MTSASGGRRSIQLSYGRSVVMRLRGSHTQASLLKSAGGASGISRVLSAAAKRREDHFSGTPLLDGLMQPTRDSGGAGNSSSPIWPCSGWGLPCDPRYRRPGALLPHPFTLACASLKEAIGGLLSAALSVTDSRRRSPVPGRYPAPCPAELGLSSDGARSPPAILTRTIPRGGKLNLGPWEVKS